jgi:hypothetical protein
MPVPEHFSLSPEIISGRGAVPPRMIDGYRVPSCFFIPAVNCRRWITVESRNMWISGRACYNFWGSHEKTLPFGHSISIPPMTVWLWVKWEAITDRRQELLFGTVSRASKLFALAQLATPITDKPQVEERLEKKLKARFSGFTTAWRDNLYQ